MYLTIYKKQQTVPDYNNMQDPTIQPLIGYYKCTIDIPDPVPFSELNEKQKTAILYAEKELLKAETILKPFSENTSQFYYTFKIPKRTGGLRTINAPNDQFKTALSTVKDIFINNLKCLSHNSAYAYTKQRSILHAVQKHQQNNSKWFLKIDLKDFFPNCTPTLIYHQLMQLYPFYYIDHRARTALKNIIKTCCLNGGLPQGTPTSPILTNLIMLPYDYIINNYLKRGTGEHYVYTRYADDILISCKNKFDWQKLQNELARMLNPFIIKTEKTRFGSRAGRNWNLGLMLNKDNNITLGHQKNKQINAMLNNFLKDYATNVRWTTDDVYTLQGHLGYLKHISPDYYDHILQKYQQKYNVLLSEAISSILNPIR